MNVHQPPEKRTFLHSWRPRVAAILLLLLSSCIALHAQLNVVYVDASNGSDSFTGANPTDSVAGQGPKATIHAGLSALANNGRLILFAGQYAGDGVDTDGSAGNSTDNADISISLSRYSRLTTGLTIELRALGSNTEIKIMNEANSVRSPSGALITHAADQYIPNFIFNVPGALLTITSTNGTEFLSLAGRHSLGFPVAGLFVTGCTIDMEKSASFRMTNGATITLNGSARFSREAPQRGNDLNLTYLGDGSFIAGKESSYPSFGAGILRLAKSAGTTVTFPSPMSFSGNQNAIQVTSGNAVFNGAIMLGIVGDENSLPRTADIIVESNGNVTFAAPLMLVVGTTAADSSISSIVNKGPGTVTFQKKITWYGSGNSGDVIFPDPDSTSLVRNLSSGSVFFQSGILLSHGSASGETPGSVEVAVVNSGTGKLSFGMSVEVLPRSVNGGGGLQQFSLAAMNTGGGTLEISGTIRSRLVNAAAGSLVGTVNITGATSIGSLGSSYGVLSNAQNGVMNLGPNSLTLLGSVAHSVGGSYITSTTGGITVSAAGLVVIDGGTLPNVTLDQPPGGSVSMTKAANLKSLLVNSGEFHMQSSLSVTGLLHVSGGALALEDGPGLVFLAGSFRQTGGTAKIGGRAIDALRVQGDFTLISGECRIKSSVSIAGLTDVRGGTLILEDASSPNLLTGSFRQSGGTVAIAGNAGGDLKVQDDFTLSSGEFRIQTSMSVSGSTDVSGGSFTLEGAPQRLLLVGNFCQSGGTVTVGGNTGGDLKVLGNFTRTGGLFEHGRGSNLIIGGPTSQVL
ncbi:MAG: hypothetical protein ABIH23_20835, partial [bacterium]